LVLDLRKLEAALVERTADVPHLRSVRLAGAGDAVEIDVDVEWKGIRSSLSVRLGEIRLRRRRLGFRLGRMRALGGLPVPRAAVEAIIASLDHPMVTVVRGARIVIVDLRQWIPPEVELSVITVQATRNRLHVWFGPGSLLAIPGRRPERLSAGETPGDGTGLTDAPELPASVP